MEYEGQNYAHQIGAVEDIFASEDLALTHRAFGYIAKAEEIENEIVLNLKQQQPQGLITINKAARNLIAFGLNAYKERRAIYYSEAGKRILYEIDRRNGNA